MIQSVHNGTSHVILQVSNIHYHSSSGINLVGLLIEYKNTYLSFHIYINDVIVSVAIRVVALSIYQYVFFITQVAIVKTVASR